MANPSSTSGGRSANKSTGKNSAGEFPTKGILARSAEISIRHRKAVLWLAGALTILAAVFGSSAIQHLSQGGFDAPNEQAVLAENVLQSEFHTGADNLVLLVEAKSGSVDSPAVRAAGSHLTKELASNHNVADVASYWTLGDLSSLATPNGRYALVVGRILGSQDKIVAEEPSVVAPFEHVHGVIAVSVGGFGPTFRQVNTLVEKDLILAELITIPITFLVLLVVYGSLVAAALPLVVGGASVLGTLFALRVIAAITPVSVFAENLTTALGLGLAIDYSLFLVSRFREELADGYDTDTAIRRTVASAGRTVAGSSLTVAGSLAVLLVFPMMFLRSFAYAGIPVALLSGVAAVIVLPAVLSLLGEKVDAVTVWRRSIRPKEVGFWSRLAALVMRRPVIFLVSTVAVLLVLGGPFLGLKLGYIDYRVLPPTDPIRQVNDTIVADFGQGQMSALLAVIPKISAPAGSAERDAEIDSYARKVSELRDVQTVSTVTGVFTDGHQNPAPATFLSQYASGTGTWMSVVPSVNPLTPTGQVVVSQVRDIHTPFEVLVGGMPAENVDSTQVILSRLPLALGMIAVIAFVVLFLMFKSILVPIKALVLNVLSLSATFGAMVWIFQEGHLSGVLGFTPTGNLLATMPLLMFCVAFGLSMDYEVFLISRIRELHDAGMDNATAVAGGLQRTGRIITAAALTMSIVFLALATSGISFVKLFGIGLTLAVLVDAFLVRGMLVPAFMRLAGAANWWAPKFLLARPGSAHAPVVPAVAGD